MKNNVKQSNAFTNEETNAFIDTWNHSMRKNNTANRMKKLTNANNLVANLRGNVGGGRVPKPLRRSSSKVEENNNNLNIGKNKGSGGYCTGLKKCVKSRAECSDNSTMIKDGRCNLKSLEMQIHDINNHAKKKRNKGPNKMNLATQINERTNHVSQIKNKLLQLNRNKIKIRQSILSSPNRNEIMKGTITAQRAAFLLKKLQKL